VGKAQIRMEKQLVQRSRLMKAWRIVVVHGIGAFLEELDARLRYRLMRSSAETSYDAFRSGDWDRRRKVETDTSAKREFLEFDGPNRAHAKNYDPSSIWAFRQIVGTLWDLGVRPPKFVLVDFGCGKGRVLIAAAEAYFREVIGIEIAPDLVERAFENLRSYRGRGRLDSVQIHCGDAATFRLPDRPLVAFLFNPFTGPVLEAVAANLARSYFARHRPMYVVYLNPEPNSPFDLGVPFTVIESRPSCRIYQLRAEGAGPNTPVELVDGNGRSATGYVRQKCATHHAS
jgi:SAM-dependent methyltransferase